MPKKGSASNASSNKDEPPQDEESLYTQQNRTPSSQLGFGVKLFVIAGLVIALFWFLNKWV